MSTALTPYTPQDPESAFKMAKTLSDSGLLSGDIQTPAQVFAIMAAGSELGLPPMMSLRSISLVKGKVTLSSELMLRLVIENGIKFEWLEDTDTVASIRMMREGWPDYTSTFTKADAQRAGLVGGRNDMYAKYPRNMLRARAVSNGARAFCPDLLTGVYVHGELDNVDGHAPPLDVTPPDPEPKPPEPPKPHKWTPEEQRRFFAWLKDLNSANSAEGHGEVDYSDLKAWLESTGRPKPSAMKTDERREKMLDYLNSDAGREKYWAWIDARDEADRAAHADETAHDEAADTEFEEVEIVDAKPKASAGLLELRRIVGELIKMIGDDAVIGDLAGSFGVEWKLEGVAGFDEITLGHFKAALDKLVVSA